ncbi:hypothetical protein Peur_047800 [Populus x canadensis]
MFNFLIYNLCVTFACACFLGILQFIKEHVDSNFSGKYEFEQRPVLIDALEPAVSLFVFYPVSTSLLELHFISTLCICSVADQFSTVIHQASSTLTLISHFDQ